MGDKYPPVQVDGDSVTNDPGGCCVVLLSRGQARPESFIKDLTQRGAQARVVDDPAYVMVELARLQGQASVVVTEPKQTRRLPQLLTAVRRYYPQVSCWSYETVNGHGQTKLELLQKQIPSHDSGLDPHFVEAAQQNDRDSSQPGNGHQSEGPTLTKEKHTDRGLHDKNLSRADDANSDALPEPVVTPEELAMLMGPAFDEENTTADHHDSDEHRSRS